jgi:PAS domain S-box-containing protein
MFGYERGDLDGKNVSILMPRPFSDRHDSYLSNYLTTGNAKILNSDRSVVGLRKVATAVAQQMMVFLALSNRLCSASKAQCVMSCMA